MVAVTYADITLPIERRDCPAATRQRMRMDEQVESFLQHLAEKRGLSVNTTAAYRTDLEQFCEFLRGRGLGDWQSVAHEDMLAFLLFLRERRYANSTVARRTAAGKSFYGF